MSGYKHSSSLKTDVLGTPMKTWTFIADTGLTQSLRNGVKSACGSLGLDPAELSVKIEIHIFRQTSVWMLLNV